MNCKCPVGLFSVRVVAVFAALTGVSTYAASPSADSTSANAELDEIVVTAQKREQRLQDVPISMTVLGGRELDRSSFQSVNDALATVPGIATQESILGGVTQLTVRGVTAAGADFAGPSPIAYYMDSVPFGLVRSAVAPNPDVYDLNSIEALRGPQGTLYGASALNGVVRVLTNDADLNNFDFKARTMLSTTDGGGENYSGDMAVNIPIVDGKLAARLVIGDGSYSGWIDSPVKNHVNDETTRNLRLKINAQPTDDLSIKLTVSHSQTDAGAFNGADAGTESVMSVLPQPIATDYNLYGAKVVYQLPALSISSSTSYVTYQNNSDLDVAPGLDPPLPLLFSSLTSKVFSEEVNLNSKLDGPWRWSAGAFYRNGKDHTYQYAPDVLVAPVVFADTSKSAAIFGDFGRRFLNNQFEWSLGLRYFHDDVATQQLGLYGQPAGTPLIYQPATFNSTTPRAVLSWYPSRDVTVYGSYSQGFRSGFPQDMLTTVFAPTFPAVKPDKLSNYEVGAKGALFDRLLTFDTAVYYMKWRDIQQVVGITVDGITGLTINTPVNGSSASGVGVDLALTLHPIDAIDLGVSLSWNNLSEDSAVYSSGELLFAKGSRIDYSPEYTADAFVHYLFPLPWGYKGQLAASIQYTSQQTQTIGTTGAPTEVFTGNIQSIGRTSLSITAPSHWIFTLFADNVGNDRSSPIQSNVPDEDLAIRPRTIGVHVDYSFR